MLSVDERAERDLRRKLRNRLAEEEIVHNRIFLAQTMLAEKSSPTDDSNRFYVENEKENVGCVRRRPAGLAELQAIVKANLDSSAQFLNNNYRRSI